MRYDVVGVIIFLAIAAYFLFFNKTPFGQSQNTTVLPTGTQGLDIVKQQRASEMSQAEGYCTGRFKGNWVDTSNVVGCYDMQGFSTVYCVLGQIQDITKTCESIGGTPTCTETQISCSV